MHFRKAALYDADTLSHLRAEMLREEEEYPVAFLDLIVIHTREYILKGMLDQSYCAWVAEHDGDIIAMGGVTYFTLPPNDWCPSGKTAYIGSLYTLPAFRKQGIAGKLMNLLISEAKEQKCQRILLHTSDMGRPLYEKLGFEDSSSAMTLYPFGLRSDV